MSNSKMLRIDDTVFKSPFSVAYWKCAASELCNLRMLIIAALFVAVRVALKAVCIPVADNLSIYVGFLANALGSSIYGPIMALISGGVCDIIGFMIKPDGPFMWEFTAIEMLGAFFYGIFLYRAKLSAWRIGLSKLSVNVVLNIILNSLIMQKYYGKGIIYYLVPRIAKNLLMLPVEITLLLVIFNAMIPSLKKMRLIPPAQQKLNYSIAACIISTILAAALLALMFMYFTPVYNTFKSWIGTLFS